MISPLYLYGRSPYGIIIHFTASVGDCWVQVWEFRYPPPNHQSLAIVITESVKRVIAYRELDASISVEDAAEQVAGRRVQEVVKGCIKMGHGESPWFLLESHDEGFLCPCMVETHIHDNRDR